MSERAANSVIPTAIFPPPGHQNRSESTMAAALTTSPAQSQDSAPGKKHRLKSIAKIVHSLASWRISSTPTLMSFYNATQLRIDTWTSLYHTCERIAKHIAKTTASITHQSPLQPVENQNWFQPHSPSSDGERIEKVKHGTNNDASSSRDDEIEIVQSLKDEIERQLKKLHPIEFYCAFPGFKVFNNLLSIAERGEYITLYRFVSHIVQALETQTYRKAVINLEMLSKEAITNQSEEQMQSVFVQDVNEGKYFEVLVVDSACSPRAVKTTPLGILPQLHSDQDEFHYQCVMVPSLEDALIAVMFNYNIQACVLRTGFFTHSDTSFELWRHTINLLSTDLSKLTDDQRAPFLASAIHQIRPELDVYLVTEQSIMRVAGDVTHAFKRIFYLHEELNELHLSILQGVQERYQTPFFNALVRYSRQPTGVFHALPLSRANSLSKSHWIRDMLDFYGKSIFLAETSATAGGLDSLLQPTGAIKKAQQLAARAFGSEATFFVTNGTSTANKIVVQAIVKDGDIVLVDRNCHKSHHYGLVIAGANVVYLDAFPLHEYGMYGGVPLREIKRQLLQRKKAGTLDQVRLLLLTNCTFDGHVYNVERFMEECLAIKPDLIFLWDEAWWAFARFNPTYRRRTAMYCANKLLSKYKSDEYRRKYAKYLESTRDLDWNNDETWLDTQLMPDPSKVRIRVYSTQSTHKTLTALRQGSMIHVYDQDFKNKVWTNFHEAYYTHTSTSPNYQILASLDVGRRQVELEGFELVQKQIEKALVLRKSIATHPLLAKYFKFLEPKDMIPAEYRRSGFSSYYTTSQGWTAMEEAWAKDEFVLDPCRLTLFIGKLGIDGDTFKVEQLMNKHEIQVNKTATNSVLFMTHIGTQRSSVAYLIEVLVNIAQEFEREFEQYSTVERKLHQQKVLALTKQLPPLPNFSKFHRKFVPEAELGMGVGGAKRQVAGEKAAPHAAEIENEKKEDHHEQKQQQSEQVDSPTHMSAGCIRKAYYLAFTEENCEYIPLADIKQQIDNGREFVCATFIIPYPPGFPILVPGQVVDHDILAFLLNIATHEIHGLEPRFGLKVFTEKALADML
eukprot:GEZU01002200.1.p1 GENE.GEZU01002200.1~~GEZU01002200.1.p1  ORF type:complete len:1075 (+),score=307.14 GEZU01002200.1:51-3275(+)